MRILVLISAFFFGHGALAQDWNMSLNVIGSERFSQQSSGQGNSYDVNDQGAYFVADSFSDGANCRSTNKLEVDYFFGFARTWEAQVLFSMEKRGNEFVVLDPAIFFTTLDRSDTPEDTYYGHTDIQVNVASLTCRPDGRFQMAIQFQGELPIDDLKEQGRVGVDGTAEATLTFQDINDY